MHHPVYQLPRLLLTLLVSLLAAQSGMAADQPGKASPAATNTVTGKWTYTLEVRSEEHTSELQSH